MQPLHAQHQQNERGQKAGESSEQVRQVVAKIMPTDCIPDRRHAVLSSELCRILGIDFLVGGLLRIEAAPPPAAKDTITAIQVRPFAIDGKVQNTGLRFGGNKEMQSKTLEAMIGKLYTGSNDTRSSILNGPLTNGLLLCPPEEPNITEQWQGGLIFFVFSSDETNPQSLERQGPTWVLGPLPQVGFQLQHEVAKPVPKAESASLHSVPIPFDLPSMIGVHSTTNGLISHLLHKSSVLLTGGLGSGKTSVAELVASKLRSSNLCHISYFPCNKLVTDETRIPTIRETLQRIFAEALWGARLGGQALIVLDDLDKLCPVETELQVGNDNSRSRQVSELVCTVVRQYCTSDSNVVFLATAQSKEALNDVIVGGHIVRDIIELKAPDKDSRRQILQRLAGVPAEPKPMSNGIVKHTRNSSGEDSAAWMDGSPEASPAIAQYPRNFSVERNVDFLDLAGQIDGYLPGDIVLLISRARSEALIRSVGSGPGNVELGVTLNQQDFQRALEGFRPASLRNVALQTSKTSFSSIGGLQETRKILLETLQYPTTYAPIFAQCPLRLRSGLLLYGYPGCGKTLLASAVAGECGLNFISVKGPEILNKYIGASEKSVRDLFERAESAKPCVLFFDEFDSIAPKRGHDSTGVTDRVVNQLLTQMDGAEGLTGVYVLAATSRPDLIDPALLRPGRLDKSIICDLPNLEDRFDILQALSKNLKISRKVAAIGKNPRGTLVEVAHRTEGYSGADLQAVMYNAHLEAIHDVLGDQKSSHLMDGLKRKEYLTPARSTRRRDFVQFTLGGESTSEAPAGRLKQLVDNAAIVTKLDDLKVARRRERQIRRGEDLFRSPADSRNVEDDTADSNPTQEVIVEWKHIEASLAITRSSISLEERKRLAKVYEEFVVGRNGEMPKGEGPRDVGGRSSLM